VFSRTLFASGFPFAVCCTVAILAAIEALHYLELRSESYWLVKKIFDVASVFETSICYMVVVKIDHDRAMFRFVGWFFVYPSKEGNFGDCSTWEVVGDFE
jgi:hypothetical protein